MRYIYKGLAVSATFAACLAPVSAQTETDQDAEKSQVQVAFRTVDQQDLIGAISVINMPELVQKGNTSNSVEYLNNEIAGYDNSQIWGMGDMLVVVDGMVRDANNVLAHEVEQITVLKGASAVVLYGPRAAKGVVQITTKRGKVGDLQINVHANAGMHTPKSYPKYMGSAEYMTYYNQALKNDGSSPIYSELDIYNYASGNNPYRYPTFDMYSDEYLRKAYSRYEGNLEVTGGSDRMKYYTTVGYYRESNLLKVGKTADNYIGRFYVRGNTDVKITDIISMKTDANVTFYDSYSASTDWWGNAASLRPFEISPLLPVSMIDPDDSATLETVLNSNYLQQNGQYFFGATQEMQTNPYADAFAAGDSKFVSRQFQFNSVFDINLKAITQGLMFRAKYGIDYASTYNQGYSNKYATFVPTWTNANGKDQIFSVSTMNEDKKSGNQDISNSAYRYTYNVSAQFDWTRTFAENHNLFAIVLGNIWQTQRSGHYHRTTNVNMGAQVSYNYAHKYYLDLGMALPYSTKLPEDQRLGFSPSATIGWNIAREGLFEDSALDELMLSASASILEQDIDISTDDNEDGYYLWKPVMKTGGWYSWGDNGGTSATEFQRGENLDMTYIQRKEITAGLRGSLWKKALSFDFNVFANQMNGGLARVSSLYPGYFTQTGYPTSSIIPYVNYNEDKHVGFDFSVKARQQFGDLNVELGVTGMYQKGTAAKRDENIAAGNEYLSVIDQPLNGLWGLKADGFYQSEDEICMSEETAAPGKPYQTFGTVRPGDLKYIDQNGDNRIDDNDRVFLGRWDAPFILGLNLTVKYKDFTFYAMGNGYYGGNGIKNSKYYWMSGTSKYSEIARYCWTPETANTALYPALTTGAGNNNYRYSDFWMYSTDRFNLRKVQLSYDMPKRILGDSFVKGLHIWVAGDNLLTIAKEREILEMNVGSAPQTRYYSFGLSASF